MDKNGWVGVLLLILLGIVLVIGVLALVWWVIGTLFGIFGYSLGFWETLAVLILIMILSGGGIHINRKGD